METKIAVITGGSRGLGRSSALALARDGVDIIFTYHSNVEAAQEVVAQIEGMGRRAVAFQLDTGKVGGFAEFARRVEEVLKATWQRSDFDFLVNNAGIGVHVPIVDTTEEQFDTLFNIHFKGVFFLTQQLLPLMANGGRIVNVSTGLTRFALPGYAAYASMKGAIEVLSRYLAKELGERGIAVNVIAPGAIETDFGGGVVRDDAGLNAYIASLTALGRVGLPDDIGDAVASLLSDKNRWVNAQRIEISGGVFV